MVTSKIVVKDYRNTTFKVYEFQLVEKKQLFMKILREQHPRANNIHNIIKTRDNKLNIDFRTLYFEKCAYCGISTQVIDSSKFEVDHVIPHSVLKINLGYSSEEINGIGNLVSSCQMCNREKQDFLCDKEIMNILHPDNGHLPKVFTRENDYSIVITSEYQGNKSIKEFYDKLRLSNQLRRLDYLIMEMKDFCDEHKDENIINRIQTLILKVESKRRRNY